MRVDVHRFMVQPATFHSTACPTANTIPGISSGISRLASTTGLPAIARRKASAASKPMSVEVIPTPTPSFTLFPNAFKAPVFDSASVYQRIVKPAHGNDMPTELLKERIIRVNTGTYKNDSTSA